MSTADFGGGIPQSAIFQGSAQSVVRQRDKLWFAQSRKTKGEDAILWADDGDVSPVDGSLLVAT